MLVVIFASVLVGLGTQRFGMRANVTLAALALTMTTLYLLVTGLM